MNKNNKRMPGRPREFDLKFAQAAILDEFWHKGFSATSVDDLSKATGMVKPSLYSAFGNKYAMYQMSLQIYSEMIVEKLLPHLEEASHIREALEGLFQDYLDVFCGSKKGGACGCLFTATAIAEAKNQPEVGEIVRLQLTKFEASVEDCLMRLCPNWSAEQVKLQVWIISSTLNHLSTYARVGMVRAELEEKAAPIIDGIVEQCCFTPA